MTFQDSSTSKGGSASNTNNEYSVDEDFSSQEQIAAKEEKRVKCTKYIVILFFTICAAAVTISTYIFSRNAEDNAMEVAYRGFANDIIEIIQWETQNNFALMEQLAATVTTSAILSNSTFPYVTNSYFEVSGGYTDGLSGIISTAFAPFVKGEDRSEWEKYSEEHQYWVPEGAHLRQVHPQHKDPIDGSFQDHEERRMQEESPRIHNEIYRLENGLKVRETETTDGMFAPCWQVAPTPGSDPSMVNFNMFSDPVVMGLYENIIRYNETVFSPDIEVDFLFDYAFDANEKHDKLIPHAYIAEPVWDSFEPDDRNMVGFLVGVTAWANYFNNLLPQGTSGITCVIRDSCGGLMTWELQGPEPVFVGHEDSHDPSFEKYARKAIVEKVPEGAGEEFCYHELTIYPSKEFRAQYDSTKDIVYTSVVALAFVAAFGIFAVYDRLTNQRQRKTMESALRTNRIVSSIFPAAVRARILQSSGSDPNKEADTEVSTTSAPIADLFPSASVLFADIAGFTSWSSQRSPEQVFLLLEGLFSEFDKMAKMRGVFKVETVGDCYVGSCGCPVQNSEHAVLVAKFAQDCLTKMKQMTVDLSKTLGPDTSELDLRIGIHSGPVTAGVLRGDNARFQLFGDTMNTAARIESSGQKGRIHVSAETAHLLREAGKGHWIGPAKKVEAKGKGILVTHFLLEDKPENPGDDNTMPPPTMSPALEQELRSRETMQRLVDWNTDVLAKQLARVVQGRDRVKQALSATNMPATIPSYGRRDLVDEIAEIIPFPPVKVNAKMDAARDMELPKEIYTELRMFVSVIAELYRDNPFHNFEHASHVMMSGCKLMSRIVAPNVDTAYGINSDPLTQFAVVFSCLIHDVDHSGVPNAQLVKERADVASHYCNQSVAEQNSIDISWQLLEDARFDKLRNTICCNGAELKRFRQIVVNCVMATDIADKNLKSLRNAKWEKAFNGKQSSDSPQDAINRKATIVIEHLIQASDVAHTMQHWHIYKKWNERLFKEMYQAWLEGRSETDPSEFWYKGEIGFFDFYIIPLAKKLKDCGVFGVSSDEYLQYAKNNRKEWEAKGNQVVAEFCEKYGQNKNLVNEKDSVGENDPVFLHSKQLLSSIRQAKEKCQG